MLNKLLSRRRNVYIFALIAIFIESFSAVCLKMAGLYPVISTKYIFYFGSAVAIMGIYAILWQILLEYMPLTTAYLRKGISYIFAYLWAFLILMNTSVSCSGLEQLSFWVAWLLHNWVKIRRIRNDHWMGTGAFICVDCFFFTDTIKEGSPKATK